MVKAGSLGLLPIDHSGHFISGYLSPTCSNFIADPDFYSAYRGLIEHPSIEREAASPPLAGDVAIRIGLFFISSRKVGKALTCWT